MALHEAKDTLCHFIGGTLVEANAKYSGVEFIAFNKLDGNAGSTSGECKGFSGTRRAQDQTDRVPPRSVDRFLLRLRKMIIGIHEKFTSAVLVTSESDTTYAYRTGFRKVDDGCVEMGWC